MINTCGMPFTSTAPFVFPLVSMALKYSIFGFLKLLTVSAGSSEIPMTTSLSPNFLWKAFNSGMAFRQGPHQVAQKSINTNLPLRSGSLESHFSTTNSGAFWFKIDLAQSCFSAAKAGSAAQRATRIKAILFFIVSIDESLHPCGECKGKLRPLLRSFREATVAQSSVQLIDYRVIHPPPTTRSPS